MQSDKRRDSWHYNINQIYDWRQQYVYPTNITTSPDNNGVFDRINSYNDDVRGFSPQNLIVSSSYVILFVLLFVCTVVCIFACMYYNISVVVLCWREVCQGCISCRHVERQPQLTPTKQVFNKCLMRTWSLCKHNTTRLI